MAVISGQNQDGKTGVNNGREDIVDRTYESDSCIHVIADGLCWEIGRNKISSNQQQHQVYYGH